MKIKKFIDKTNKITIILNRHRFLSPSIYEVVNTITQPEMKHTNPLKLHLIQSTTKSNSAMLPLQLTKSQLSKTQMLFVTI